MKLILRTLKGKRSPTAEDIDALVLKHGIFKTFLGAEAHHVASHDFVELDGHYVTDSVGFGFGSLSSAILLAVVSREDPGDVYYFTCDRKRMVFSTSQVECEGSRMLANQIRRSIQKCPSGTTPDDIATAMRPELESIRTVTNSSLQSIWNYGISCHVVAFAAILLLTIAVVWAGGQFLALVKDVQVGSTALTVEVKDLRNTTHILTAITRDGHELAGLLQASQKKLQQQHEFTTAQLAELNVKFAEVDSKVAEVDSRNQYQDRRLDEIGDRVNRVEATQKHYQPAIDGPPKNSTDSGVGPYAPRGDSVFDDLWYAIKQMGRLALVIVMCVYVIGGVVMFLKYRDDQNALLQRKRKAI
jgi:hypothetical protein